MNGHDWEWQRLKAESELKDLDGDAFETRFQEVAKLLWKEDFIPTIPMGRRGDLKCDGFRTSTGTVYQCFGPRYGQTNVEAALAKIGEDFRERRITGATGFANGSSSSISTVTRCRRNSSARLSSSRRSSTYLPARSIGRTFSI